MKVLIIDDEILAIKKIKRLLGELGYTNVEMTTDIDEAIESLKHRNFDIVFLDINMPQKSGLDAAIEINRIAPKCSIIFVTAYDEYALQAYSVGALDYIMKPVTKERLQSSVNRAIEYIGISRIEEDQHFKILAKSQESIRMINSYDIYYIEAQLNDTIAYTQTSTLYTGKRISELESLMLHGTKFVKVHRSYIVNIEKIDHFKSVEQGKYCIHFKDISNVIYTSRSGAQNLREYFEYFT